MSTKLQPADIASFFASVDRRLDEREPAPDGEVDEVRRDVELIMADLDKKLVLTGFGEGDLEQAMGGRLAERLKQLDDQDWSKPVDFGSDTTLLDHARAAVDDAAKHLRS